MEHNRLACDCSSQLARPANGLVCLPQDMDAGACTTKCVELLSAADAAPAPALAGPGSAGWAARCRKAGVPEDCDEAKLAFAEHGAAQPSCPCHSYHHPISHKRHSAAHFLTPCSSSPGTMVRGTPTGKLNDDLPSEEEDDGEGMGDFAADIGGGKDDY